MTSTQSIRPEVRTRSRNGSRNPTPTPNRGCAEFTDAPPLPLARFRPACFTSSTVIKTGTAARPSEIETGCGPDHSESLVSVGLPALAGAVTGGRGCGDLGRVVDDLDAQVKLRRGVDHVLD